MRFVTFLERKVTPKNFLRIIYYMDLRLSRRRINFNQNLKIIPKKVLIKLFQKFAGFKGAQPLKKGAGATPRITHLSTVKKEIDDEFLTGY